MTALRSAPGSAAPVETLPAILAAEAIVSHHPAAQTTPIRASLRCARIPGVLVGVVRSGRQEIVVFRDRDYDPVAKHVAGPVGRVSMGEGLANFYALGHAADPWEEGPRALDAQALRALFAAGHGAQESQP